jgi:hypothetical protein
VTPPVLADLYRSLKTVGFTRGQVASILPEWWSPDIARTSSGMRETVLLLGRRLSLDAGALLEGRVQRLEEVSAPRYKHTVRVTAEQLLPATLIAFSLAKAIVGAMRSELSGSLPRTPEGIRRNLLAAPDARIDFDALLTYCWRQSIPVIPLPNLPKGIRKMDAAAIRVGQRPAIVIALRNNSKAWLSFLLAHELGHLCLNHVPQDTALVEGSLSDSTEFDAQSQHDMQELQANAFAHTLLGGAEADAIVGQWPANLPPVSMAIRAMDDAVPLRTAPGHLVLRRAFLTHKWPEARLALNFLAEDMDAQSSLVQRLREEIDTAQIGSDLQEYVEQVTGVEPKG